jgi:hypothetical protein
VRRRPLPAPWEWCDECETDLRDYEHAIWACGTPCSVLQARIDAAHQDALEHHCSRCGADQSKDWWEGHAPTCPMEVWGVIRDELRDRQRAYGPAWPLHWPSRALLASAPWRAFLAAA